MARSPLLNLFLLAVLCLPYTVRGDEKPCTYHDGGRYYDLSRLSSSKDYVYKAPDGSEYYMNVCRSVTTETWAIEDEQNVAVFRRTKEERGDLSLGSVNTTLAVHDGHPLLYLTNGSPCPSIPQLRAASVIRFICDTFVFEAGQPQLIAELPGCSFFFEWRSHYACQTNEPNGSGGVVVILGTIALILMMGYLVAGTLYRRFVLNLRGFDQVPRISFFSLTDTLELCSKVTDLVLPRPAPYSGPNSFNHQHSAWNAGPRNGGRPSAGYERLAASDEERQGMLHGDEDDDTQTDADVRADHAPKQPTERA
ncbi:mannose 6-phosphate receptor domain-containing protein [Gloeophyllum trabeum ATCC 11539]|uniref:Mannose 6-phosphate receptor domain-containing protein n=1 Tax=Gloeophyllum trabeum (strain ATCC 11539 / FP-39264 / Madison 617) TaxID=670483 RepID=S7QKI6_GLOTA|nr:mannose 6-phosphate receptor domain-containing protein [Gloeophyllum trabeum ATCC 11539]EPQ60276.1 mannose 6-phosphate receptor domain-containing protein [Gloeophyllum trabeum ATCC 11539]